VLKDEIKFATPIVALTAETGSDVRERCKEIGKENHENAGYRILEGKP
jgi:hypothetical protein